jgi:hypothetical protein
VLRSSNKSDRFFKAKLDDANVDPPPFLWHRIETQLPSNTRWYNRHKYLLLLALLSIASASGIFIGNNFMPFSVSNLAFNKPYHKNIQKKKSNLQNPAVPAFGTGNRNAVQQASVTSSFYLPVNSRSATASTSFPNKRQTKGSSSQNVSPALLSASRSRQRRWRHAETVRKLNASFGRLSLATDSSNSPAALANSNGDLSFEALKTQTASLASVNTPATPLFSRTVFHTVQADMPAALEAQRQSDKQLNKARKKMQRNQKQFSGYDINKGFHIGLFFLGNSNWLNEKQYSAGENTLAMKAKMQFGKSYGINIGFDYTDRWGIEMEWQLADQGQKYLMTEYDGDHLKNISLRYTKFPLMIKYRYFFKNSYTTKPIGLSFLFGPHMSFLLKQKVTVDGHTVSAPDYNKVETGFMGGFDFDVSMTRYMTMTIGARTGFGTAFRKTQPMSFSVGITTQFNFRFPRKLK